MRVLHSAFMAHPSPGILNQMRWEQEAARELGLDWTSRLFAPEGSTPGGEVLMDPGIHWGKGRGVAIRARNWYRLRSEYYAWLVREAETCDVLLLRYSTSNPLQLAFLRSIGKPVFTVHHTLELPELETVRGLSRVPRRMLETICGAAALRMTKGLVGVTEEIVEHELSRVGNHPLPTYCYPNGILYKVMEHLEAPHTEGVPELIFICSHFSPWQGLDLLLDSTEGSDAAFVLHLVGSLGLEDEARARRDPRVIVHGLLAPREIAPLLHRSWVGLSSLALHRKGMVRACTLKAREYLMAGLPVYASHLDVFDSAFPYFRNGEPDISAILTYAAMVRDVKSTDVSSLARPLISKLELLGGLYEWLNAHA